MSAFEWVQVAVVLVMSSSRLTRLWTHDQFPPIRRVREAFIDWTDKRPLTRPWGMLGWCPWCVSFWITAAVLAWGWLSDWHVAWWLFNSAMGASYLAAIVMIHDGDDEEDED